jgi:predicted alpha/beta hydrolase family esterase
MKNAVILHGKPSKERYLDPIRPKPHQANWLPWLAGELESKGIPVPYAPDYPAWQRVFERHDVTKDTAVIGHSYGAGFIIRWLSENKDRTLDRVVLVGPSHHKNHESGRAFYNYDVDPNLAERVGKISILNSTDDTPNIQESVALLMDTIPGINYTEVHGFGHFMLGNNMTTVELPEIWSVL